MSHPAASGGHFASVSCSLPRAVFSDGLTFSLPLVLTAVPAAHWLSFLNCSSLAFHCLLCLVCFSQKNALLCFFLVSFFLGFSFLKLHKGTRTHAQLPRRPVPPPKPRRSKKGVSRCRMRLPTSLLYSPLWFASLSVSFIGRLLLTQRPGGIFRSVTAVTKSDSFPELWYNITTMSTVDLLYSSFIFYN